MGFGTSIKPLKNDAFLNRRIYDIFTAPLALYKNPPIYWIRIPFQLRRPAKEKLKQISRLDP